MRSSHSVAGASNRMLIVVPTKGELDSLRLGELQASHRADVALCGFGPVASACRTMRSLCAGNYSQVLLCGLAGTYTDEFHIGEAVTFRSVTLDGVGVIEGGRPRSGYDLGFDRSLPNTFDGLVSLPGVRCAERCLTVCLCSASTDEARQRMADYPGAAAEDMEGYGVAMACHLQSVPLTILRGISNTAGDRDKARWKIGDALDAVRSVLKTSWCEHLNDAAYSAWHFDMSQ